MLRSLRFDLRTNHHNQINVKSDAVYQAPSGTVMVDGQATLHPNGDAIAEITVRHIAHGLILEVGDLEALQRDAGDACEGFSGGVEAGGRCPVAAIGKLLTLAGVGRAG